MGTCAASVPDRHYLAIDLLDFSRRTKERKLKCLEEKYSLLNTNLGRPIAMRLRSAACRPLPWRAQLENLTRS